MTDTEKPKHLRELSKNELIWLQTTLKGINYNVTKIDGIYGHNTRCAFNQFKLDYGLNYPDYFGETTKAKLESVLQHTFDLAESEPKHSRQPILTKPYELKEVDWYNFKCPVSKYFCVGEVSHFSQERIVTDDNHKHNVIKLARQLDIVREKWGKPIGVTSWYRPILVNRRVGGAVNSQHTRGLAADIYPIDGDVYAFQKWLDKQWLFALGYGAKKGFVHVDLRQSNPKIRWNY